MREVDGKMSVHNEKLQLIVSEGVRRDIPNRS